MEKIYDLLKTYVAISHIIYKPGIALEIYIDGDILPTHNPVYKIFEDKLVNIEELQEQECILIKPKN